MTKDLTVNKNIIIKDWAGNLLFSGINTDSQVDQVLDANRCKLTHVEIDGDVFCDECGGTGYSGDFTVEWEDQTNQENVYEHINY